MSLNLTHPQSNRRKSIKICQLEGFIFEISMDFSNNPTFVLVRRLSWHDFCLVRSCPMYVLFQNVLYPIPSFFPRTTLADGRKFYIHQLFKTFPSNFSASSHRGYLKYSAVVFINKIQYILVLQSAKYKKQSKVCSLESLKTKFLVPS